MEVWLSDNGAENNISEASTETGNSLGNYLTRPTRSGHPPWEGGVDSGVQLYGVGLVIERLRPVHCNYVDRRKRANQYTISRRHLALLCIHRVNRVNSRNGSKS